MPQPWTPYTGPYGGHGWKNPATGEVRYQDDMPHDLVGRDYGPPPSAVDVAPPPSVLTHTGLSPLVKAKVSRAVPGAGREIALKKHEVEQVLRHGLVGFVSAGRNPTDPADAALTDAEVAARHELLRARLVEMGCKFMPVRGHYGGEEDSFLVMVPEVERHELVELGRDFRQDSVIFSENGRNEMIFTTGANAGKAHVGEGWQPMPDADDFYSELTTSDGRRFKFQLSFNFEDMVALSRRLGMATNPVIEQASVALSRLGLDVMPTDDPMAFLRGVHTAAKTAQLARKKKGGGSDGQWVTIGAQAGEDGKKHGGVHVQIKGGKVTKGPKGVKNKHIGKLDKNKKKGTSKKGGQGKPPSKKKGGGKKNDPNAKMMAEYNRGTTKGEQKKLMKKWTVGKQATIEGHHPDKVVTVKKIQKADKVNRAPLALVTWHDGAAQDWVPLHKLVAKGGGKKSAGKGKGKSAKKKLTGRDLLKRAMGVKPPAAKKKEKVTGRRLLKKALGSKKLKSLRK